MVGGVSSFDKHLEAIYRESLHSYEASLDFIYLTDLDMPSLLERLKHLPDHTIVLYRHIGIDFSQRLVLLALGLENAEEAISTSPGEAVRQMHSPLNSASEIGADLHTFRIVSIPRPRSIWGLFRGSMLCARNSPSNRELELIFSPRMYLVPLTRM